MGAKFVLIICALVCWFLAAIAPFLPPMDRGPNLLALGAFFAGLSFLL